jgi:hypothetical protein
MHTDPEFLSAVRMCGEQVGGTSTLGAWAKDIHLECEV